jgi:hypothetical protein
MKLDVLAIYPKTATKEGKVTFLVSDKEVTDLEITVSYKTATAYGAAVKEAAQSLAAFAEKFAERAKKLSA